MSPLLTLLDLQFIQVNRADTLVMLGSENSVLAQKLSVPAELLGSAGSAIVTHVNIQDLCMYAEAAVNADDSRW